MFKLSDPDQLYTLPVTVNVPADGGSTRAHRCSVQVLLLAQDDLRDTLKLDDDYEALGRFVRGWDDIGDPVGEPLPFSDANLRTLANIYHWSSAVLEAYLHWRAGAATKNSATPPVI